MVVAAGVGCGSPDEPRGPPAFTWQRHALPRTDFDSVTLADDRFFTIGPEPGDDPERRVILASEDGIEWSVWARPDFDGDLPLNLMWVDGQFIAILYHRTDAESGTTTAWVSPDAKTWKPWFDLGHEEAFPQAFAKIDGRWVATVTPNGPIMTSEDGQRWVMTVERPFGVNGRPITGPGGLVIPAPGPDIQQRGGSQVMLSSADGLRWSETTLDDGWIAEVHSTAADDRIFVALGHARTKTFAFEAAGWWSTDGLDWQRASMPAGLDGLSRIDAVAAIADGFIALWQGDTAESPHLLWSPDGRSWFGLEGGPIGRVALPRLIVEGNHLRLYLQPDDADGWEMWEALPDG